jgi:thioesterase domain-containing protein/acyl carrier protein
VTHANLLASTLARLRRYPEPVTGYVLLPPLAFDSSVAVLFHALCRGGTLVLPAAAPHEDLAGLADLLAAGGVSHWLSVPSLYALALERLGGAGLAGLCTVIVAGEVCPPALAGRHFEVMPGAALLNEYGPTEATVWSTIHRCSPGEEGAAVPIGRPIPGSRAELLDPRLAPVPIGVAGELYLGGPGVARGYAGRPDLTAERFVPDPWGGPGARLYRTGDLARWRRDGSLHFLGRCDAQLKVRGVRIEPGEVEAALAAHPAVREAAVVARDGRLVAFVVSREETTGLRAFLAERLPAAMVPGSCVRVEELPRTATGKVDRRALASASLAARPARTAARDGLELRLCRIWEEILGRDLEVGVEDDFFDLGGHSLAAVRLMARIETEWGCDLPLSVLFHAPTVAALAQALRDDAAMPPIPRSPLVRLATGGEGTPMFWVHPVGGTVVCYRTLARHLGTDRPVYALEAAEGGQPLDSVEQLAERYLEAVLAVWPRGPYLLGGWSFGGLVALEMGRRLEVAGREVGLVALVDTAAPGGPVEGRDTETEAGLLAALTAELGEASPETVARARRRLEVARAHLRAGAAFAPRCPRRAVLFLAAESLPEIPGSSHDSSLGWNALAGDAGDAGGNRLGLEPDFVPGDHYTLLREPHVRVLAERLRARLAPFDVVNQGEIS